MNIDGPRTKLVKDIATFIEDDTYGGDSDGDRIARAARMLTEFRIRAIAEDNNVTENDVRRWMNQS